MKQKLTAQARQYLANIGRIGGVNRWSKISMEKRKAAMRAAGIASGIARRAGK